MMNLTESNYNDGSMELLQNKMEVLNERLNELFDNDIEEYNKYRQLGAFVENALQSIEIVKFLQNIGNADDLTNLDIMAEEITRM